jgi:O-methyltransferase involved in polyketide biosynthesis
MSEAGKTPIPELSRLQGVPQTLCIPLWARAEAQVLAPEIGLHDPVAKEWCTRIGVDPAWLKRDPWVLKACISRAKILDDITRSFIQQHSQRPVVILSLGAGLCTRMDRLHLTEDIQGSKSQTTWIDLDLPEVMALRNKIRPAQGQHHSISASLLETQWLDELVLPKNAAVLVLIEGVLVYLKKEEVTRFLAQTTQKLLDKDPNQIHFAFDFLDGPAQIGRRLSSSIRHTQSELHWVTGSLVKFLDRAHTALKLQRTTDIISRLKGIPPRLQTVYRWFRGQGIYSVAEVAALPEYKKHSH